MKIFAAIALLCLALAVAACGGGDSTAATENSTAATEDQGSTTAKEEAAPKKRPPGTDASEPIAGVPKPPKVDVPAGPPPTDLIVKDLKRGSGPAVKLDSMLALNFIGVDYKSHKPF